MKKTLMNISLLLFVTTLFSSCYCYTSVVGKGPQSNVQVTKWNHYILFGLAPIDVSDSKSMAGGATDYSVLTRQSFVNGLVSGLTFGIYTPTTTTVTK
jgi:hypothetical protein